MSSSLNNPFINQLDWNKAISGPGGNLYNNPISYSLPDNGIVFLHLNNQSNIGSSTSLTNDKISFKFNVFGMGVGGHAYGQYQGNREDMMTLTATSASTVLSSVFVPFKD